MIDVLPARLARVLLLACLVASGACKQSEAPPAAAAPAAATPAAATTAGQPVAGVAPDALGEAERLRFERLVDQLPSPCGKAQSLRTSRNEDPGCFRAPFAVAFVIALLTDGASDEEIAHYYAARYPVERKQLTFQIGPAVPRRGPADARVVFVEFFDYGCPICKEFTPLLAEVQGKYPRDVAVVYKMFPVHPGSAGAAQAALAAARQGKFEEMSALLFADQGAHARADLDGYARKLKLDPKAFAADFEAAAPTVAADQAEGHAAGVDGTPTVFLDGVLWEGPPLVKYLAMTVDEELARPR